MPKYWTRSLIDWYEEESASVPKNEQWESIDSFPISWFRGGGWVSVDPL